MSLMTLENELPDDLRVCIGCLSKKRKLFNLHKAQVFRVYQNLMGFEIPPDDTCPYYICRYCTNLLIEFRSFRDQCQKSRMHLEGIRITHRHVTPYDGYPQYICKYCTNLLIKFNTFKEQCLQARIYLDEARIRNNGLPNLEHANLNTTDIKITSYIESETDLETDNFEYNTTQTNLPSPIENLNTHTPEIKNENFTKKSKGFESKDNLKDFEMQYDVDITILSVDQQYKDVLDRKLSGNYLSSPYKCELCYKGFMGDDLLKKHVLMQHDPSRGNIVCEFCSFRYKDRRGLNQHLKSHRLKFACKQCSYVSRTTFNAKEHFKMHGGQLHECRHCGKAYEKLSSHLTHLRIQHPSQLIWCDVCGEAFIGDFGLNAHKKRAHTSLHLPSICTSCDARFVDTTALNRHLSADCCGERSCVHCGENFTQALDLRDHLLDTHRSCKIYACEKCDKTFSRQSLYSAHYRRIHVTSERGRRKEKPWVCEVCGKTLPNKCMLLYHQRNHTGEKPYNCTQCAKSFTMKKLLQSHLRVHSSDRPYACGLCPKTFKGLSALRAHERIHTGGQEKMSRNITI